MLNSDFHGVFCMPTPSRLLSHLIVIIAWLCFDSVFADEATRLSPIAPKAVNDRQDPLKPKRLTSDDRKKLYEQVAQEANYLERQAQQIRRLTDLLRPTVVHIDAKKPMLRPRNGKASEEEAGSGVITKVAGRTVVITNRHVVNRAELENIAIRLEDGREITPKRLWSDAGTDIGVMEIQADNLEIARLATNNSVQIGDSVLAIGSPFGLAHSVTIGIVSAKGRRDLELGEGSVKYQDFIQTDAAINPGNSGGPLVNLRGEVIGLNTAIASNSGGSEGIAFAIPISMVMFVSDQLVRTGTVSRAYLGVTLDSMFTQDVAHRLGLERPIGARVSAVTQGSPADRAGIKPNDVIFRYDGTPIEDDDHLVCLVSMTPTDQKVTLGVFRNRKMIELAMPVASRDQFE